MNFATAILVGLQHKPMYGGTVPEAVVQQRRAKNRAARRARRGNSAALRRQARLNGIRRQGLHRVRVINPFNRPVDDGLVDA